MSRRWSMCLVLGLAACGCKIVNEQQAPPPGPDDTVYHDDGRVYRDDRPNDYHPDQEVRHYHDDQWNDDRARDPQLDDSWQFLGRRVVDFHGDHDTFKVGRSYGRFHELRFVVRNGDLDIYNMLIIVGDGDKVRPDLRVHYDENTVSRSIDLPGDIRTVQRVDFEYRSTSRRDGRAIVALYGK